MTADAIARPRKGRPALWAIAVVALVVGAGLATWRLLPPNSQAASPNIQLSNVATGRLIPGNDYYFYIKLIELAERDPNGRKWDRLDGSGPDIRFRLTWRRNVVWTSTVKKDTLIGSWDLMKIDLRQVIASGGQAELEGALNAPLIHYAPGETLELQVWDDDSIGSDEAGMVVLKLDELRPGETSLAPAGGGVKAIKRVVLALIDRKTPLPELLQAMSNR